MRAIYAELSSEYAIILIQGLARVQMLGIDPYLGRARFVDFICVIVRVIAKTMLFFSLSECLQHHVVCISSPGDASSAGRKTRISACPQTLASATCTAPQMRAKGKTHIGTNQQSTLYDLKKLYIWYLLSRFSSILFSRMRADSPTGQEGRRLPRYVVICLC